MHTVELLVGLLLVLVVTLIVLHRFIPYPGPCDYVMMALDWVMSGFRSYFGPL